MTAAANELAVERLEAAIDRLTRLLTAEAENRTPMLDGGMLTVAEAAAELTLSEDSVRAKCRSGEIGNFRHGRAIRIPRHALEQWLLKAGAA